MTVLVDLAKLIRSKNAGPFVLTFDIMFSDKESYLRVKNSGVLTAELVAKLYRCPVEDVRFFVCDNALSFKASIPRPIYQGELGDGDLHGGQQFTPLMYVSIP